MIEHDGTPDQPASRKPVASEGRRRRFGAGRMLALGCLVLAGGGAAVFFRAGPAHGIAPAAPPLPTVTVSAPLERTVAERTSFLGQFSAVDRVEIRAQVGGTLSEIRFRDGQIVHKGDLLFVIDERPYQIRLAEAIASVKSAEARLDLANSELWRARQLKQTQFGTAENVDQRVGDQEADTAALEQAEQAVRDAELDLDYCHIVAPFTGRISNHLVSVGNLVSGSRGGTSATTLLTTIVSLDPIHLDFDMSENDYLAFVRAHGSSALGEQVPFRLSDEQHATRTGTLDFVDNEIDRGSGTIHARATVPNPGLFLVPGEFARLSLATGKAAPALLVPDSAVMLDQSQSLVMTVAPDGTVVPKLVDVGPIVDGLRVIRSGLAPTTRVIIDGVMHARPGTKVNPMPGAIVAGAPETAG